MVNDDDDNNNDRSRKLQTLVERAYKNDPRVIAWKKEQERIRLEKEVGNDDDSDDYNHNE